MLQGISQPLPKYPMFAFYKNFRRQCRKELKIFSETGQERETTQSSELKSNYTSQDGTG